MIFLCSLAMAAVSVTEMIFSDTPYWGIHSILVAIFLQLVDLRNRP